MRTTLFCALAAVVLAGCAKQERPQAPEEKGTLELNLSIEGTTKATGQHDQTNANTVSSVDIFIFNNTSGSGTVDAYRHLTTLPASLTIPVSASTAKRVVVLANSHQASWAGYSNYSGFNGYVFSLAKDNVKDFAMVATSQFTPAVGSTSTLSLSLSRMAAMVELESLKASLTSPYNGMTLSNIKVFLVNAAYKCNPLYTISPAATGFYLNKGGYIQSDVDLSFSGGASVGISTATLSDLGDGGEKTGITPLYAYPNPNTGTFSPTRLVVQADLNGKTYYYPISINTTGVVESNKWYRYKVIITGPGSESADIPLAKGAAVVSCTVTPWTAVTAPDVDF